MKSVTKALFLLLIFSLQLVLSFSVWGINLFNETYYRSLIADRRAFLPGDVLTVIVLETSNAQTSADLASGKSIKTALEGKYNKQHAEIGFGLKGHGKMSAKTGRNGKIKASLTVRIKEVMPNGTYLVEGHQFIVINGEQQTILLKGIVRQEDISAQNTVLSTRLGNAKITYTGDGSVSNSQKYNVIYKVLSFMGLV